VNAVRALLLGFSLICLAATASAQTTDAAVPPHVQIRILEKNMNIWLPFRNMSPVMPEMSGELHWDSCASGASVRYFVAGTGRIVHGRNIIEITNSGVSINGIQFSGLNAVAEPDGKVIPNAFIRTFQ
jgi:hypothetical protein